MIEMCDPTRLHPWTLPHALFLTRYRRIIAEATEVLGSFQIATYWLVRPAIGLAHFEPCCLLVDQQGYEQVCDYLCRLKYCVYT